MGLSSLCVYVWICSVDKDTAAAAAKSLQSCSTLCEPIDGSPPGSHPWGFPGKNTGVGCHSLLWNKDTSHVVLEPTHINSFYLNYLFNLMHMVNTAMKLKDTYSLEENLSQT